MSSLNRLAIGGYLELELPQKQQEFHKGALKYQSARAAFTALLLNMPEVKRVWMPAYICDSMLAPIKYCGKECIFYNIENSFDIDRNLSIKKNDLILYVNYFGVCEPVVHRVLSRFNPDQVIIDCSQAFYAGPYDCLATIYSPRKFFGVPDGGLIYTRNEIKPPLNQDRDSIYRVEHLIKRLAFSAEEGYSSYQRAELSLDDCMPKRISELTKKILATIDFSSVQKKRIENFQALHEVFGRRNRLNFDEKCTTPLCYPFLSSEKIDKKKLSAKKIFIPTYWPDVLKRDGSSKFERSLVNFLIAMPCNQNIDIEDIYFLEKEMKS